MTPEEAWSSFKPSVAHLRVFGCIAYAKIPEARRIKLDDKGEKCIFVGYGDRVMGYKLYNPLTKKVIISRDVVFEEDQTWSWEDKKAASTSEIVPDQQEDAREVEEPDSPTSPQGPVGRPRRMRNLNDIYEATEEVDEVVEENKFKMESCNPVNTPVEISQELRKHDGEAEVDPTYFKSLVGSLRYLTCTRPDILYGVGLISRYMETPSQSHLNAAKRILRYIKGTLNEGILYPSNQEVKLVGYSDSDWGRDLDERKSTTGYCFYIGDGVFTWSSKKQAIVTLSTCEAEYVAASSTVCHCIWLRNLLTFLGFAQQGPTEIHVDNKYAIALAKNPVFHERSKHIDTRYHFIREHVNQNDVELVYCKSQDQAADIFTKPL
ncbi:hypothetical protein SASPL_101569 [Salvia splendens]|uniref:Retroviral polymerase SH3-like domain-containing protein n=1 Tax=Salvia splendens TaxID=180675 RepID=A0A8X9ABC0_SALSN|nr:hypothetical protein SASPL_101569 [Salvia splendens]